MRETRKELLRAAFLLLWLGNCASCMDQCSYSQKDQQFCNMVHSVCMYAPDKLCLAQSVQTCIGYTDYPSLTLESIEAYIVQYLDELRYEIPTLPEISPKPEGINDTPTQWFLPSIPSVKPIRPSQLEISPNPIRPAKPEIPIQPKPPIQQQEKDDITVIIDFPQKNLEPEIRPSYVLKPIRQPQEISFIDPTTTQRPQPTISSIKQPTHPGISEAPEISTYGHIQQSPFQIQQPRRYIEESPIYKQTDPDYIEYSIDDNEQYYILKPGTLKPPVQNYSQVNSVIPLEIDYAIEQNSWSYENKPVMPSYDTLYDIEIIIEEATTETPKKTYTSGNQYVDYIIQLLISVPEDNVRTVIQEMIQNHQPRYHNKKINVGTQERDIELVELKLNYLFDSYVNVEIPQITLEQMLVQIFGYSTDLFQWLVVMVDEIYSTLKIDISKIFEFSDEPYSSMSDIFSSDYFWRKNIRYCHADDTDEGMYCERYCHDAYGGNWIAIQSRERETASYLSFDRLLSDYVDGFGSWRDGYWMGLDCLHDITAAKPHELLIELTNADGDTAIAHYENFLVESKRYNYKLHVGKYLGGSAGDSMSVSNGMMFTTQDNDVDKYIANCATRFKGGWWYRSCTTNDNVNSLNAVMSTGSSAGSAYSTFVKWNSWNTDYAITATRMFIRVSEQLVYGH